MTLAADNDRTDASGSGTVEATAIRVLLVAGNLPYLVRFRSHLLRSLVEDGHHVIVATPDSGDLVGVLETMGVMHATISLAPTGMNPLRDLRDLGAMIALQRRLRPDLVFAYGAKPILLGLGAATLLRVPRRYGMLTGLGYSFVKNDQRSVARALARGVQVFAYRHILGRCARVIFHNDVDREELVRRGVLTRDRTVTVAGSGVDVDEFTYSPVPTEPIRFLFVGRLLRSKGVEELVHAARRLRAEVPSAEVHLVGTFDANPDQIDVAALRKASSDGDIVLHGQVADVRPHLASCSVFVLPSYREGLPRSALEALASGRTTILTDIPGCREIVRPGLHGTLVPVRDIAALAAAMIGYARDPERCVREGAAARATAKRDFDVVSVTRAMRSALDLPS